MQSTDYVYVHEREKSEKDGKQGEEHNSKDTSYTEHMAEVPLSDLRIIKRFKSVKKHLSTGATYLHTKATTHQDSLGVGYR